MRNILNRLALWMRGRYGFDDLGKGLFIVYLILVLLSGILGWFVQGIVLYIFRGVNTLLAVYIFWRIFSRNIYVRRNENMKYLAFRKKIIDFFRLAKNRFRDRKTHVYRKCPECGAVLRLKKIKGEHRAACPRCGKSFGVKV